MPAQELDDTYDEAFGDPKWAKASRADPLVLFDAPRLRTAAQILSTCGQIPSLFGKFSLPVLVLHGEDDRRTDPANSKEFISRAGSTDKTLRLYPGMKHQLLQDKPDCVRRVYEDVLQWLKTRRDA
jgi:alpha-beta hydrolase superfamily lysophospholipase